VFTCARNAEVLKACLDEWKDKGYSVDGCVADVSIESDRLKLIDEVKTVFGNELNALVNNVGTNVRKRAHEFSTEEYKRIMETNLDATFHLTTKLHPLLKGNKGSVVTIGSVAGKSSIFLHL
jgi:Tropinone reductase 1